MALLRKGGDIGGGFFLGVGGGGWRGAKKGGREAGLTVEPLMLYEVLLFLWMQAEKL